MNKPSKRSWNLVFAVTAIFVLIISPILYVLSIGPALWMQSNGMIFEELGQLLFPFYFPVRFLHQHTPLQEPLEWYFEYCGG